MIALLNYGVFSISRMYLSDISSKINNLIQKPKYSPMQHATQNESEELRVSQHHFERKDLEELSAEAVYSWLINKVKCSEEHIIKTMWVDKLKIDGKKFMTLTDKKLTENVGVYDQQQKAKILEQIQVFSQSSEDKNYPTSSQLNARLEQVQQEQSDTRHHSNGSSKTNIKPAETPSVSNPQVINEQVERSSFSTNKPSKTPVIESDNSEDLGFDEDDDQFEDVPKRAHKEELKQEKIRPRHAKYQPRKAEEDLSQNMHPDLSESKNPNLSCAEKLEEKLSEEIIDILLEQSDTIAANEEGLKEFLNALEHRLKFEKRDGPAVRENFKEIKKDTKQKSLEEIKNLLQNLKKLICPIDEVLLRKLIQESLDQVAKIKGKDLKMFIGRTGAGKTTTFLQLLGALFEKDLLPMEKGHIVNYKMVKDPDPEFLEYVDALKTDPHAESCTTGIFSVDVKYVPGEGNSKKASKKSKATAEYILTLVDTPGQGDTRGPEQSIAGQKAIDVAAQHCKSVVPVIVISSNFGDKMTVLRDITKIISGMLGSIKNIEEDCIQFLITKVDVETDDYDLLLGKISDFKEVLDKQNSKEKLDENFKMLFNRLKLALDEDDDQDIVMDPTDPDKRQKILKMLKKAKKIEHPASTFKMNVTDDDKTKLMEQIQIDLDIYIKHLGINHGRYDLLEDKLQWLSFLNEQIPMDNTKSKFQEAINSIKTEIHESYHSCHKLMMNHQGKLLVTQLHEVYSSYQKVSKLQEILMKVKTDNEDLTRLSYSKQNFNLMILEKAKKYLEEIQSCTQPCLSKQIILTTLENLKKLSKKFEAIEPRVVFLFQKGCQFILDQFQSLIKKSKACLEQFDFEGLKANVLLLRGIQSNLMSIDILPNEEVAKVLDDIYTAVRQKFCDANDICQNFGQKSLSQEKIQEQCTKILSLYQILSNAKKFDTEIEMPKRIVKFQDLIKSKITEVFDENYEEIKKHLKNKDHLSKIQTQMKLLKLMSDELLDIVGNERVNNFFRGIYDEISRLIEKDYRSIIDNVNLGYDISKPFKGEELIKTKQQYESLTWFDDFEQEGSLTVSSNCDKINEDFENLAKSLSQNSTSSYELFNFAENECYLKRLQSLGNHVGNSYEEQHNKFNEFLQQKVKEISALMAECKAQIEKVIKKQESTTTFELRLIENGARFIKQIFDDKLQGLPAKYEEFIPIFTKSQQIKPNIKKSLKELFDDFEAHMVWNRKEFLLKKFEINCRESYHIVALKIKHVSEANDNQFPVLRARLEQYNVWPEIQKQLVQETKRFKELKDFTNHWEELKRLKTLLNDIGCLDNYLPLDNQDNTFRQIAGQINVQENKDAREEIVVLQDYLKQNQYEEAYYLVISGKIPEHFLDQAKNSIRVHTSSIWKAIDNKRMVLHLHSSMDDISLFKENVQHLIDAQHWFIHTDPDANCSDESRDHVNPGPGQENQLTVGMGEQYQLRLSQNVKSAKRYVNDFFMKFINGSRELIKNKDFENANQTIENMTKAFEIFQDQIDQQKRLEFSKIRDELNNKILQLVKIFKNADIKELPLLQPRTIINKINLQQWETHKVAIQEHIKEKYVVEIEKLIDLGVYVKNGLQNQRFLEIRRSICSLPPECEQHAKIEIERFEASYNQDKARFNTEQEAQINDGNFQKINETLILLNNTGNESQRKKVSDDVMEKARKQIQQLKDSFDTLATNAEQRQIDLVRESVARVNEFEQMKDQIPSLQESINKSKDHMRAKLLNTSLTLTNQFVNYDMIKSPQGEKDLAQLEKQVRFVKATLQMDENENLCLDLNKESISNNMLAVVNAQTAAIQKVTDQLQGNSEIKNEILFAETLEEHLEFQKRLIQFNKDVHDVLSRQDSNTDQERLNFYDELFGCTKNFVEKHKRTLDIQVGDASHQLEEDITKFYTEIYASYSMLKRVANFKQNDLGISLLHNEANPGQYSIQKFEVEVCSQVTKLQDECIKALKSSKFQSINVSNILKHFKCMREVFQEQQFSYLDTSQNAIDEFICFQIEALVKEYNLSKSLPQLAKCLVGLKDISVHIHHQKNQIDTKIDEMIEEETAALQKEVFTLCTEIKGIKGQNSKGLLLTHKAFKEMKALQKNKQIHNPEYGLGYTLEKIKLNTIDCEVFKNQTRNVKNEGMIQNALAGSKAIIGQIKSLFKDSLKESQKEDYGQILLDAHETYLYYRGDLHNGQYDGFIGNHMKQDPDYLAMSQEVFEAVPKMNKNKDNRSYYLFSKNVKENQLPKLIGKISGYYTVLDSKKYFQAQSDEQQQKRHKFLFTLHPAQAISIMRMLGIANGDDEPTLDNHLIQVQTGGGKSVVIAITAIVLALIGYDVYCACYSKHLSDRDYQNFIELFEKLQVSKHIHYGTIESLCESYINKRINIRKSVERYITQGEIEDSCSIMRPSVLILDEVDTFFGKQFYGNIYQSISMLQQDCVVDLLSFIYNNRQMINYWDKPSLKKKKSDKRKQINKLVGLPFVAGQDYHSTNFDNLGQSPNDTSRTNKSLLHDYSPQSDNDDYRDEEKNQLQQNLFYYKKYIKNRAISRADSNDSKLKLDQAEEPISHVPQQKPGQTLTEYIQETEEYKQCLAWLGEDWKELLDEQVKDMLYDINFADEHSYILKEGEDRIGYLHGDRVVFNKSQGYLTAFAYIKEHQNNKITEDSLRNNVGIRVCCGNFSFAEIPKKFNCILGISGTVETTSVAQKREIYATYGFKHETIVPSYFGDQRLIFKKNHDVHLVRKQDYHHKIKELIDEGMSGQDANRPVLVFFADKQKLHSFLNSEFMSHLKNSVRYLTEDEATPDEISEVVKLATQSGQISFYTRYFGRGTDFEVNDDIVKHNKGTCVIQTFPSDSLSEQLQIQGRTARQGDEGLYKLVVNSEDLEKFNATYEDAMREKDNNRLHEYLMELIEDKHDELMLGSNKGIESAEQEHKQAESFLQDLYISNLDGFKDFILKKNKGREVQGSKTFILIDGTYSMYTLLAKAKACIQKMFQNIEQILEDNQINANIVNMKIGVYRNYNEDMSSLWECSEWECESTNLKMFLDRIEAEYGWGNEAIEVGFYHAVKEIENNLSQCILIGDAPPNDKDEFKWKREGKLALWNKELRGLQHYQVHLQQLKQRNINIHTMYLKHQAKQEFEFISNETGGESRYLDVNNQKASKILTDVISTAVLKNVGGEQSGQKLVDDYILKFGFTGN